DGAAGHRSSHRNQTPQMPLTRLKDSAFDAQVEGVYFGMWNGSIPVRCLVSQEALTDKAEGASLAESLDVFHEYRSEIENLAGVKCDVGQIKSDGFVVVAPPDPNPEKISTGVSLILGGLTRGGSRVLADAPPASSDAPIVRRLRAAGAERWPPPSFANSSPVCPQNPGGLLYRPGTETC